MKKITMILATLLIVSMVAGCVELSEEIPIETSLGEMVEIGDVSFTVTKYEIADSYELVISNKTKTHFPSEGAKYLWIYVTSTNICEVATTDFPEYSRFSLLYKNEHYIHSDGFENIRQGYYVEGRKQYDPLYDAYPGVTVEGWVLFEVPQQLDITQTQVHVRFAGVEGTPVLLCNLT